MDTVPVTRRRKTLPTYRTVGCAMTRSHTPRCHRICKPEGGKGICGRVHPSLVQGRTQQAIARYKEREKTGS